MILILIILAQVSLVVLISVDSFNQAYRASWRRASSNEAEPSVYAFEKLLPIQGCALERIPAHCLDHVQVSMNTLASQVDHEYRKVLAGLASVSTGCQLPQGARTRR